MANQLLQCAAGVLDETPARAPQRQCVVYGSELVWDECDCGLLAVHVPQIFPSDTFPVVRQAPAACNAPWMVAEYVITILRCVPQPDNQGRPPKCDEIEPAAARDFSDRWAVMRGVQCCLADYRMHVIAGQLAVGEAGACAGSELHVFVATANCVDC